MRIAWFTHRYAPCIGGAETYGRAMVRRFVADGHAVDVYTSDAQDLRYYTDPRRRRVDAPPVSAVDGAIVHRLPVRHVPLQRYAGRLLSYLPHWPTRCQFASYMPIIPGLGAIRGDYDAVFGVGFPFTVFSFAAFQTARASGVPLILTPFLHLSTPGDPVNRTYTRPHQIRLLAEADLVVSPTPMASEVVAGWGVPRSRLLTLPMAIERSEVTGGDRNRFRVGLGLGDAPIVGQLGALDPNKGTTDLVLAVERLNAERSRSVELVLAGSATPEFEAFLAAGGWTSRPWLHLLGPIPAAAVPDFYAGIDVFAMPSRTDSFGIVYLEAWANGKPVVAAAAGGVPEVVKDGEAGRLVPFGDVARLTDALGAYLDDPRLAALKGAVGRGLVEAGYTWEDRYVTLRDRTLDAIASRRVDGPKSGGRHPLGGAGGRPRAKVAPLGLFGTLAIVFAVEAGVARRGLDFTGTAVFSWTLSERAARHQARGADILCFGDSLVKHGLLPEAIGARLGREVYNLSACAAQAPTSYYLLKHALDAGARPGTVVVDFMPDLLTGSPEDAARYWPELLRLGEVAELARSGRRFTFLVRGTLDRLLPTLRSRGEIRRGVIVAVSGEVDPLRATNLTHGRNWTIHRGAQFTPDNPAFDGTATNNDHFRLMSDRFWCNRVNRQYVHRFLALASSRGIPVYWVLPPVSPAIQARREASGVNARYSEFVAEIAAAHPGVVVLDARKSGFDHARFVDPIHLTGRGALALSGEVADAIAARATGWVNLPPYRDRPVPFPLEDVEQSRQTVIAALGVVRR